jgi:hypothetical protein
VCGNKATVLANAPGIKDLSPVVSNIGVACSRKFVGKIYYEKEVYIISVANSRDFLLEDPYLMVFTQGAEGNVEKDKIVFSLYSETTNTRVYQDTIPNVPSVTLGTQSFDAYITDTNRDSIKDLRVPTFPFGNRMYFAHITNGVATFARWISAGYSTTDSYLLTETEAYYNGVPIDGVDHDSFDILNQEYAKDARHVYSNGRILPNRDPTSFVVLGKSEYGHPTYTKDKNNVYVAQDILVGADPATFEVISASYAKDAKRAYWEGIPIRNADVASFTVFEVSGIQSEWWSKDARSIFYTDDTVPLADPATFRPINKWFGKDAHHLYSESSVVSDANLSTVETFSGKETLPYIKDAYHVYWASDPATAIIGADPASFTPLTDIYSKDNNAVYRYGVAMEGVNPFTFNPYQAGD